MLLAANLAWLTVDCRWPCYLTTTRIVWSLSVAVLVYLEKERGCDGGIDGSTDNPLRVPDCQNLAGRRLDGRVVEGNQAACCFVVQRHR
jgi:hypothetical protein